MIKDPKEFLWEVAYRPKTISECILPSFTRKTMEGILKQGELSNMLISSSSPGTGKTTVARALANDLGYSMLFINASEDSGIDTIRSKIRQFASTLDMEGRPKVVILDEADGFSEPAQKALRGAIEEFSASCRFIFTANYQNKIIDAIRSRLTGFEFVIPKEERQDLMKQMIKRCLAILKLENVPVSSPKVVAELVSRNFPDNRHVLVELQNYSRHGEIDEGILGHISAKNYVDEIIANIKQRNFPKLRELAVGASDNYAATVRGLYSRGLTHVENQSKGDFILTLAENMKYEKQVADIEIHTVALFVELMTNGISWKTQE